MTDDDAEPGDATTAPDPADPDSLDVDTPDQNDKQWEYAVDEFPTDPSVVDPDDDAGADTDDEGTVAGSVVDPDDDAGSDTDDEGNVAGSVVDLEGEIEPGSPSAESVFFVVLGVLVTTLFFLTAAGLI